MTYLHCQLIDSFLLKINTHIYSIKLHIKVLFAQNKQRVFLILSFFSIKKRIMNLRAVPINASNNKCNCYFKTMQ